MNIRDINPDIIINILNFIGFYTDYTSLKYTNKHFNELLYNLTDAIYYLDELNYNTLLTDNHYQLYYKNIFFNQLIIIKDIKQIFSFNLEKIRLLDINLYDHNMYYDDHYDIFNENSLKKMYNLTYLNISESNITYLPDTLINLEYLNISDTCIKTIPKTFTKLKYLICVSFYNSNLRYIPKNISLNLEYLELINSCNKSIYLSDKIKYLDSYEGNKKYKNFTTIYINNIPLKTDANCNILYIEDFKKINTVRDFYIIPKLYSYCLT
jgi:hypothetical protein